MKTSPRNPLLGRMTYIATYPGIRARLWHSKRAYALIVADNMLLLTKNWLGLQQTWRLPGGGVHDDETPLQAVCREVHEELGLDIDAQSLELLTDDAVPAAKNYVFDVFLYRLPARPTIDINQHELVSAEWFELDALPAELSEHVRTGLQRSALV